MFQLVPDVKQSHTDNCRLRRTDSSAYNFLKTSYQSCCCRDRIQTRCGALPWHPIPFTVYKNRSTAAENGPGAIAIVPTGMFCFVVKSKDFFNLIFFKHSGIYNFFTTMFCFFGRFGTINGTLYMLSLSSKKFCHSRSAVVWKSCPQACIQPSFSEL